MVKKRIISVLLMLCLLFSVSGSIAYANDVVPMEEVGTEEAVMDTELSDNAEQMAKPQEDEIPETKLDTETKEEPSGQSAAAPAFRQASVQLYSNTHLNLSLGYPDNRFFTGMCWDGSTEYGYHWKETWNDTDFNVPGDWLWMLESWDDTYGSTSYYTADGHRTSNGTFGIDGQLLARWRTGVTNAFYNCEQYLELNPDVAAAGIFGTAHGAWAHWLTNGGLSEWRRTSYGFNPVQYRQMYGDLSTAFGDVPMSYYKHYGENGVVEGRWGMYLNVYLNANGGSCNTSSIFACYQKPLGSHYASTGTVNALPTPTRPGYVFDGWYDNGSSGSTRRDAGSICPWWYDVTLVAHWHPGNSTYTVNHYLQNVDGNGYTLAKTQNLSGTTDTTVTPGRASYTGFTAPAGQSITINGNGTASVSYYYTRNRYSVSVTGDAGISSTSGSGSYYYGASVSTDAAAKSGYAVSGVTSNPSISDPRSFTMPAGNVTVSYTSKATTAAYTVRHWQADINGGWTLAETESFTGNVGSTPQPAVKSYVGFTQPQKQEVTVTADGKASVDYYYTRNKYTVAVGGTGISGSGNRQYYYGETVSLAVNPAPGYRLGSAVITPSDVPLTNTGNFYSFTMPAEDVELTVTNLMNPVTITVPRQLIMGRDSGFSITADNQAGVVTVHVPDQIVFTQKGKHETVTGRVSLSGTTLTPDRHTITGSIVTDGFSAGRWEASFYLEIDFAM